MTRLPFVAAIAGATLLSASAAVFAAPDGQASGSRSVGTLAQTSCNKAPKIEVAQSSSGQSTNSSTFVDVAGSDVSFNIGGSNNTCIIVSFSAQGFAPSGRLMHVRALRDGSIESVDSAIQFVAESTTFSDAHAYNFVFTNVPPGAHTVKMQFRSQTSGSDVFINDFDMLTYHK